MNQINFCDAYGIAKSDVNYSSFGVVDAHESPAAMQISEMQMTIYSVAVILFNPISFVRNNNRFLHNINSDNYNSKDNQRH